MRGSTANSRRGSSLRPASAKDRLSLLALAAFLLAIATAAAGLFALQQDSRYRREEAWLAASATIVDARPRLVGERSGMYGGFMLCQVEVLAAFDDAGTHHGIWATLDRNAMTLDEARFQMRRAQGARTTVRWQKDNQTKIEVDFYEDGDNNPLKVPCGIHAGSAH